ncbi:MAG: hypothetical protein M1812_001118 [Candelaria pacifica]|nr:MAG: hypothetical protein M1812_001118 [Candelaria pacifica]
MSSSKSSNDGASQYRIMKHMNADHLDSLVRFLEHKHSLSSSSARTAHLIDMELGWMLITFRSPFFFPIFPTPLLVEFEPPLQNYKEARERLVSMDKEAIRALGRDDITAKEYKRPRGFHAVVFAAVVITVAVFWTSRNFRPGSTIYDTFLYGYPNIAWFLRTVQPLIFWIIVTLHPIETLWMDRTRLRKHSVPRLSGLWWKWMLSTLVEGVGAFQRLDALVAKRRLDKERQKH